MRYRRKVISGGRAIDMQSGWMLWVIRGWDGFVSNHFILFLLLYFFFLGLFSPGFHDTFRLGSALFLSVSFFGVICQATSGVLFISYLEDFFCGDVSYLAIEFSTRRHFLDVFGHGICRLKALRLNRELPSIGLRFLSNPEQG